MAYTVRRRSYIKMPVICSTMFVFILGLPVMIQCQDSLKNEKEKISGELINKYMIEYRQKYDSISFEEAIAMLAESNREKRELLRINQRRARRNNMILLLGLFLATGGAIYIFWSGKRLRHTNQLLKDQSQSLSESLEEKNFLLKEVHHRVKNNLQVVSSLLKLQSRSSKDQVTKDALDDGRSRIKSMALIHQNLYLSENVSSVFMPDYIQQLIDESLSNYNTSSRLISINTQIDQISLDIDSALPIGLILNELISNSLKHAFREGEEGTISVELKNGPVLRLAVEDSGQGFQSSEGESGFGLRLIKVFVEKLKAELSVSHANGTRTELLIRKFVLK